MKIFQTSFFFIAASTFLTASGSSLLAAAHKKDSETSRKHNNNKNLRGGRSSDMVVRTTSRSLTYTAEHKFQFQSHLPPSGHGMINWKLYNVVIDVNGNDYSAETTWYNRQGCPDGTNGQAAGWCSGTIGFNDDGEPQYWYASKWLAQSQEVDLILAPPGNTDYGSEATVSIYRSNQEASGDIFFEFIPGPGTMTPNVTGMVIHGHWDGNNVTTQTTVLQGEVDANIQPEYTCWDVTGTNQIHYDPGNCNSNGYKNFVCPTGPTLSNGGEDACLPTFSDVQFAGKQIITTSSQTSVTAQVGLYAGGFLASGYLTNWVPLGNGITESQSITTSWTNSDTTSTGQTVSSSFSVGLSATEEIEFGVEKSSVSMSEDFSFGVAQSTEDAVSRTEETSETKTCSTQIDCAAGELYQWQTSGTQVDGSMSEIRSCYFACISQTFAWTPRCPAGSCSSPSCYCCNQYWTNDSYLNSSYIDYRTPGLNGTCHPPDADSADPSTYAGPWEQPTINLPLPNTNESDSTNSPTSAP